MMKGAILVMCAAGGDRDQTLDILEKYPTAILIVETEQFKKAFPPFFWDRIFLVEEWIDQP